MFSRNITFKFKVIKEKVTSSALDSFLIHFPDGCSLATE